MVVFDLDQITHGKLEYMLWFMDDVIFAKLVLYKTSALISCSILLLYIWLTTVDIVHEPYHVI